MTRSGSLAGIVQQLRQGYECEVALYGRVRDLAHQQAECLRQGADPIILLRLAFEQEEVLRSLEVIGDTLAPARHVVAAEYDFIDPKALDDLNAVLDRIDAMIQEIRVVEMENYATVATAKPAPPVKQTLALLPPPVVEKSVITPPPAYEPLIASLAGNLQTTVQGRAQAVWQYN